MASGRAHLYCLSRRITSIGVAATLATLSGCAVQPAAPATAPNPPAVTTEALLAGDRFDVGPDDAPVIAPDEILALDDAMVAFIHANVDADDGHYRRLQQLLRAVISDGSFGLVYAGATRTAAGTFSARSGNCLSFTNMFVAMAREAGLDAHFQEVDIPPDWSLTGDSYVLNRHINVKVELAQHTEHVVDFNIDDFRSSYDRREISDARAFAHFYSNQGVAHMQAGDYSGAFRHFRAGLTLDPTLAPAWSNLGALYARIAAPKYAEAAWLETLRLQPNELLAMSNLARLYSRSGEPERAAEYRHRVDNHRNRNPYYRYELARQAFLAHDYQGAIDNLKFAVRRKRQEDQFYFLMGLSYLQLGDARAADKWLRKAAHAADDEGRKHNYENKIDWLMSNAVFD